MGLVLAAREKDRAYLASKIGLLAVELDKSGAERCTKLSFEVAPDDDFGELARELAGTESAASCATMRSPAWARS